MLQWSFGKWFSLGIHADFRTGGIADSGKKYGPYVDLYVGPFALSLGRYPNYTHEQELILTHSRGGESPG